MEHSNEKDVRYNTNYTSTPKSTKAPDFSPTMTSR